MKRNTLLVLTCAALAVAGCSSTPTKVKSGVIHARTFSFVDPGPRPAPTYADNRPAIHQLVQDAITKNLTGRGLSRVDKGGQITVGYLVIVGNNASTTSIRDYFGYGEDASGLQDKAHTAYTTSQNPNYFEAGTLVIDIIDSKTFKLLSRGYASRQILREKSASVRAARMQEVVDEILREVRFAP